jgi:hypothetical protein
MAPIDPFFLTPQDEPGESSSRPCGCCAYDLRGLPAHRPCPECGHVSQEATGSATPSGTPHGGTSCIQCNSPTPGLPVGALCVRCAQKLPPPGRRFAEEPTNRECNGCGYDLRATPVGAPCPECGQPPLTTDGGRTSEFRKTVLASGELSFRISNRRTRSWLFRGALLATFWSVIVVGMIGIISMVGISSNTYNLVLAICVSVAAIAIWPLSPNSLDRERPAWLFVRFGGRVGLACWALGLWWYTQSAGENWGAMAMQLIGLVGGMLYLAVLASVARELELLHAARKLTTSAVLLIPIGLYTFVMPFPEGKVVIDQGAFGFVAVVFVLISIVPWYWLLLRVARSVLELASEARWTERAHQDYSQRAAGWQDRMKQHED